MPHTIPHPLPFLFDFMLAHGAGQNTGIVRLRAGYSPFRVSAVGTFVDILYDPVRAIRIRECLKQPLWLTSQ